MRAAWLTLEPPPRLTLPGRPSPTHPLCNLGFSTLASQVALGSPQLELGGLRQALSDQPVLHRALTSTEPLRTAAPAAAALADRYLGRTRTFVRTCVRDGQAAGLFRADLEAEVLATIVMGTVQALALGGRHASSDGAGADERGRAVRAGLLTLLAPTGSAQRPPRRPRKAATR